MVWRWIWISDELIEKLPFFLFKVGFGLKGKVGRKGDQGPNVSNYIFISLFIELKCLNLNLLVVLFKQKIISLGFRRAIQAAQSQHVGV